MKKNQTQKLVIAGIAALTIGLFSACGGGNESGKGAAKGIATNGIMGNVPALVAQFDSDLETLALKMKEEQSDEKRAKLVEEYDELCSTIETTMKEAVAAVNGKEVPAEVQ